VKIPPRIAKELGEYVRGLEYGNAALEFHVKGGAPRIVIKVEKSIRLTEEELRELFQDGGPFSEESVNGGN